MSAEPHVYSCEWTDSRRVYCVDGEEHHLEQVRIPVPRRHVVRSSRTADYEAVAEVEPLNEAGGPLGGPPDGTGGVERDHRAVRDAGRPGGWA